MFAIALAVSFDDTASPSASVGALLDAWPCSAPDGRAVASAPGAAAGVLRWSVVARDRMVVPIWDAERQLLFVGDVRLYNRKELGDALEIGGTADLSDAELAWRAYLQWGENAPGHLVGDFAFAVWNARTLSLFAARDHFGVRPLYYIANERAAYLASDVQQLLAVTPRPFGEINAQTILERSARGRRTSGLTFFRNISALPGGHAVTIARGACRPRRYWVPSFQPASDREDHPAQIRALFRRAVRDRLESDQPIVAHLSGGFDSSAIVMVADDLYREEPNRSPLVTASAMTEGMPCDDSFYIDLIAHRMRFESFRWNALEQNLADVEDPVVAYPGLRRGTGGGPRRDLELAQERNARVLLHGYFGDGLTYAFGIGRDLFRSLRWRELGRHVFTPGGLRARARILARAMMGALPPPSALRALERVENRSFGRPPSWMGPELRARYPAPPEQLVIPDADWPSHLVCELWARLTGPRTANAIDQIVAYGTEQGVEVRLPYLDVRLAEKIFAIPWQARLSDGDDDRRLGREALGPLLPVEFARRRPGSWTPVYVLGAMWMLPAVERILSDGDWLSAPYVELDEARSMLAHVKQQGASVDPRSAFLATGFGVLEAWLRKVFRYDSGREG